MKINDLGNLEVEQTKKWKQKGQTGSGRGKNNRERGKLEVEQAKMKEEAAKPKVKSRRRSLTHITTTRIGQVIWR